ncbi:alkaline phosphatase D family protein [Jiangella muralis]|uniref:alkaline phosphatase D family protein n=1 Tax=Jiangella muralis TaxID=702383 RepID=UPI00069FC891|nr:alkaline phosphatase D family protein [Jiangella muralis]
MAESLTRRRLLGAAGATGAWLAWAAAGNSAHAVWAKPRFTVNPFTLGVASGEPAPDGVVLWTRLAPDPLAADGSGGMPAQVVQVQWQVATDPAFANVVAAGTTPATPELGHSVHTEVTGLAPDREFFYRFHVGADTSAVGRTRTTPVAPGGSRLKFALACCQNYAAGHYTAYEHLAQQDIDLVVFVGDYIYEGPGVGTVGRPHQPPREIFTLADYRIRYAQYKTDPALQAAHARAPWLVVFDDHEVDNNWAGGRPSDDQTVEDFLRRRALAFQAYYESMPLRPFSAPVGDDIQVYRRATWGGLATFHVLDTRQFRDPYACGGADFSTCPEAFDPARTMLGFPQEAWLADGFGQSQTRWDFVAQQGAFVRRWVDQNGVLMLKMDAWDGYVGSQQRVTQAWVDAGVRNPVVLSGDIHAHWASDLKLDYDTAGAPLVGSELIATSISSGGTGRDHVPGVHPTFADNPHLRFYTNLRGYITVTVTPDQLQADYQCVRDVTVPGAEVFRRASFVIDDGVRGLRQIYDGPPAAASARELTEAERRAAIDELIAWESGDEQEGV